MKKLISELNILEYFILFVLSTIIIIAASAILVGLIVVGFIIH
nr:MAG TPA: hypothetical protein [Caudoviricetes sp.]